MVLLCSKFIKVFLRSQPARYRGITSRLSAGLLRIYICCSVADVASTRASCLKADTLLSRCRAIGANGAVTLKDGVRERGGGEGGRERKGGSVVNNK